MVDRRPRVSAPRRSDSSRAIGESGWRRRARSRTTWRAESGWRSASRAWARPKRTSGRSGGGSAAKVRSAIAEVGPLQGEQGQAPAEADLRVLGVDLDRLVEPDQGLVGLARASWSAATRTIVGAEAGSSSSDRK